MVILYRKKEREVDHHKSRLAIGEVSITLDVYHIQYCCHTELLH